MYAVAGINFKLTYEELANVALAIRAGARFIGTNSDATYPSERGPLPGAGSILALLATATGQQPLVIGKPNRGMYELAMARLNVTPDQTLMVGDRYDTDISGAIKLGLWTAGVLTGISTRAWDASFDLNVKSAYLCTREAGRHLVEQRSGAIVNVARVNPMPKSGLQWNVMEIEARGPQLTVRLNGQQTASASDTRHARGRIAFQYGQGVVRWRNATAGASPRAIAGDLVIAGDGPVVIALDRTTIADFSYAGYLFYDPAEIAVDWKDYPNIDAWRSRVKKLPGWKGPHDMLPPIQA